jgi:predicted nuclease of predicted toxin-antitoxin system
MRFLADAGISRKTVEFLRLRGHDAVHVRDLLLQRAADRDLVDKARADSRTVLTGGGRWQEAYRPTGSAL